MLTVITGTPGAAKTLYAVSHVDRVAQEQGRPVFYAGIPGVRLAGWQELRDVTRWHECPEGALIVLDETSRTFPPRGPRDPVPEHVRAMDDHRHRGHDVFVICQHSTQIDTYVRKMAGCHIHLKRMFSGQRSAVFEWPEIANERDKQERREASRRTFKFPREYFDKYKSASLHTVKARPPWRLIAVMACGALAVPVLLLVGLRAVWPDGEAAARPASEAPAAAAALPASFLSASSFVPAVADVPYSAPFYRELIAAQEFPRVSGCMRLSFGDGRDVCSCNDQQGNKLALSYGACLRYLEYGSFDFSGEWSRPTPYVPPLPAAAPVAAGGVVVPPAAGGGSSGR